MAEVDFSDREQAEAWFKTQSHEMRCIMSARAALRVAANFGPIEEDWKTDLVLASFRATVTSAGRGLGRLADVEELETAAVSAAHSAGFSAFAADSARSADTARSADSAHSALSAADSARSALSADSARSALSARSAAHSAMTGDAQEDKKQLYERALWTTPSAPDVIAENHELLLGFLRSDPDWRFWHDWYQGMWNGTFRNWDLAIDVAKIPDEFWEGDDALSKVAREIERIEARLWGNRLSQAEKISRDDDDGLYTVETVFEDPDDLISKALKGLDFPLELALRGHNQSGFSDLCVAFQYLDHTRQNCADDPNAIHTHFKIARELIEDRLKEGSYLPEDGLVSLVQYLERYEVQLRADHPLIRETNDRLVQQRLRELDDEKRLLLAADFRRLTEESKERLSVEYGLDATVLEQDSGIEAQADAIKRSGGRSQIMAMAERVSDTAKKVDASGGWKATKIGMTLTRIASALSGLF